MAVILKEIDAHAGDIAAHHTFVLPHLRIVVIIGVRSSYPLLFQSENFSRLLLEASKVWLNFIIYF